MTKPIHAHLKVNGCGLSEQERFAYCLMYLSSLLMANHAATTMRQFIKGRDRQVLGQEIKNRQNRLNTLAARVSMLGNSKEWQVSEDRLETKAALISEFAIMVNQFDDCDEMIDFFSDRIKLIKLDAIGYVNAKNQDK